MHDNYSLSHNGDRDPYRYVDLIDLNVARIVRDNTDFEGKDFFYCCYLLTTWGVETRANIIYPIYNESLKRASSFINLKSILNEEDRHLSQIEREISFFEDKSKLMALVKVAEERLFETYIASLLKKISANSLPTRSLDYLHSFC